MKEKNYELTTDLMEIQFGPVNVEILSQEGLHRVVRIKTESDKVLEYADVVINEETSLLYPAVHNQIVAGMPMGKAFREHSVPFERRNIIFIKSYPLSSDIKESFETDEDTGVCIVAETFVGEKFVYSQNIEIYSPDLLIPMPAIDPGINYTLGAPVVGTSLRV